MKKYNTFLLVEDDPDYQEIFLDGLNEVAPTMDCYAVSNGQEALAVLMKREVIPDVIFTDLNMPYMNGFEFLKSIKHIEELKTIPVVVYSTDDSKEQVQRTKDLGAIAFYAKGKYSQLRAMLLKYLPSL